MSPVTQEVQCPICSGPCFDNRTSKSNPRAPDYRCKDKSCTGVIWPPRKQAAPRSAPQKAPLALGDVPELDDHRDPRDIVNHGPDQSAPMPADPPLRSTLALEYATLWGDLNAVMCEMANKTPDWPSPTAESIQSATATVWIAYQNQRRSQR
jgi:hypothetical protein